MVWIIVIVVLAAVIWAVVSRSRHQQLEARREEAAEPRDPAAEHTMALPEPKASAPVAEDEVGPRSWQERARDRADDLLGQEDDDGDGRRG